MGENKTGGQSQRTQMFISLLEIIRPAKNIIFMHWTVAFDPKCSYHWSSHGEKRLDVMKVHTSGELGIPKTYSATKMIIAPELDQCTQEELSIKLI